MPRVLVLGLGRFGAGVATELARLGVEVFAVDRNRRKVEEIDSVVSQAVCLDVASESAMKTLHLEDTDLAVVCVGNNIESSLLATTILQHLGVKEVWVRAVDDVQVRILQALKVQKVLNLEQDMAAQVAHTIANPGTRMLMPLTAGHLLVEIAVKSSLVGKTLAEMDFRNSYGVNVIAIKSPVRRVRKDGTEETVVEINDLPRAGDVIKEGDTLVLIGSEENVKGLQKMQ